MKANRLFNKLGAAALSAALLLCTAVPSVTALAELPIQQAPETQKELKLWYDEPAENSHDGWMKQALPIGNGYMGGMVFGGTEKEVIQFNEKTLWSGGPGSPGYNYGVKEDAYKNLDSIRQEIFDKGWTSTSIMGEMFGDGSGFGKYQNFGQMEFDFGQGSFSGATNYQRYLDLRTATAGVTFEDNGITYIREYFTSYPDNVMVMKLSASQNGALSFGAAMKSGQDNPTITSEGDTITMTGLVPDNKMMYESQVKIINQGGSITATEEGGLQVTDADSVLMIMSAGTNYKNSYPDYRGEDPHQAITDRIAKAAEKTYDQLRQTHLEDFQEIFSRVELDLDHTIADVPTDDLMTLYNGDTYDSKQIEVLLYQYGRYLMISSSREGSLPANLQGVWNDSNNPAWSGDYHFNVNVQMNYWPAYVANMAEIVVPLTEYVESLRVPGRKSAEEFMGIVSEEGEENGWMVTTMNNPFGYTSVGWGLWGWAPASNAWISQNLWEYYEFTGDEDYLREKIYPIIKESAVFWTQALVEDPENGRLVSVPSYSPEQGPATAGCTFDQELVWQLYTDVIEASTILGVDEELRNTLVEQKEKLDPLQVGSKGQIKEWREEEEPGFPGWDEHHRHISQLVGLYPGKHITEETPEYFDAAKVTLNSRGDDGTGWSLAHKMSLWARALDGDRAYDMLHRQLQKTDSTSTNYGSGGTYTNLFCAHPPFQIDGNAGATAGMSEMLLQSHAGYIQPLAALPSSWANGRVDGLVARGNFEIGIDWANGGMKQMTVDSKLGGTCKVKYDDIAHAEIKTESGSPVAFTANGDDMIEFETVKGERYLISGFTNVSVSIDGERYTDFNMTKTDYSVTVDKENTPNIPVVAAEVSGSATVEVVQAAQLPGTAEVKVTNTKTGEVKTYTIRFNVINDLSVFIDGVKYDHFDAGWPQYTIALTPEQANRIPKIEIKTKGEVSAQVKQASGLPGMTEITAQVGSEDPKIYTFHYEIYDGFDYLSNMDFVKATSNATQVRKDQNHDQNPLSMRFNGEILPVEKGVFAHPKSEVVIDLTKNDYETFESYLAIDQGRPKMNSGVIYQVEIDGQNVFTSDVITKADEPQLLQLPIPEGAATLTLKTVAGPDGNEENWSMWAYAKLYERAEYQNIALLDSISVDGKPIEGFLSDKDTYSVVLPEGSSQIPEITATPVIQGGEIRVVKPETGLGTVVITVASLDKTVAKEYRVTFTNEPVVPGNADKTILQKVIDAAWAAKESGELAAAIPSVQASFNEALDHAEAVNGNDTATQQQVDQAWIALMTEIHKLGFVQGDKAQLQALYDASAALNQDLYEDGVAKDNFNTALTAAKAVLNDPDAMQNEIDKAHSDLLLAAGALVERTREQLNLVVSQAEGYAESDYLADNWASFAGALSDAHAVQENPKATQAEIDQATDHLLEAMMNLRFKPNKDLLKNMLDAAQEIDRARYTQESIAAFSAAAENGRSLYENPQATQEEVDAAVDAIQLAQQQLVLIDGITAKGDVQAKQTSRSAKTGDTTPFSVFLATGALALLCAGSVLKRKQK